MMFGNRLFPLAAQVVFVLLCVSTVTPAAEMRVLDLLIAEGATDVTYVKRRGDVRYEAKSDFKTMGNFYAKNLAAQGWSKSAKDNLQRNFWVQTFSKGKLSLVVRVSNRKGGTDVRLTPTGMMWEEDDQPTPKDLPIPSDATDKEYSDFFEWIEFKSPSNVRSVEEFMTGELAKREWTKTDTSFDRDDLVMIKFAKQKSSISLDIREDDEGGSEVKISTKGMQWDGMKAEIGRAKKEADSVATERETEAALKRETPFNPPSLPKRKDKPKQGIDKLPKLSNEAAVVMDGKTYKLSSVIAYEVFDNEEWMTKVVATRKGIKQDSLLARLKKTGSDKDEDEHPPSWPEPYLEVVIEEDDRVRWMSFRAGGAPGIGSNDELTGAALVEDGRARGKVRLTEPGSFFEKVYTAEISFDVPVLTRESTPEKRLANAPKLANAGKLIMGNRTYTLTHAMAYEMKFFDDTMTSVVLSQEPLNMTKLKAALGRKAADHYFEFTPQVKLLVDADDNVSSVSIWADNQSIGGNQSLDSDIVIEDGRARGTAKMTKPGDYLDTKYSFNVSFDLNVLRKRGSTAKRPAGSLAADSFDGGPVPEGHDGIQSKGSRFRKQSTMTVAADLKAVVDFYRSELTSGEWGEWQENHAAAKVEQQSAELAFSGPTGSMIVQLRTSGRKVAITLVTRDARAAQSAGLLPAPGEARLFIANESRQAVAFTINKRDYSIQAGAGAKNPKTGFNWEVSPGNYTVQVKPTQSEKLKISANETWGVIFLPSGGFYAARLY